MRDLTARDLRDFINDTGELVAQSYSGRRMYGAYCVSVQGQLSLAEVVAVIAASAVASSSDLDEAGNRCDQLVEVMKDVEYDTLGRGLVIYWPKMLWLDEFESIESVEDTLDGSPN